MKDFEIIEHKQVSECYNCKETKDPNCKTCNGSEVYVESNYILIYGNIAFDMDLIK